jgi:UPF0271 protein
MSVDLNADVGEGMANDAALLAIVTSANVACAAHAGDAETIRQALLLARKHKLSVGAHVGYFDRAHYGRTEQPVNKETIHAAFAACVFQIGSLVAYARHFGVKVRYVKPHGALYNQACRDLKLGEAVAAACQHFKLPLMVLANSPLHRKFRVEMDLIAEGFADRGYRPDGSLIPRSEPGAILNQVDEIVAQVERLVISEGVESVCFHGDTPDALRLAKSVRLALERNRIRISPCR